MGIHGGHKVANHRKSVEPTGALPCPPKMSEEAGGPEVVPSPGIGNLKYRAVVSNSSRVLSGLKRRNAS